MTQVVNHNIKTTLGFTMSIFSSKQTEGSDNTNLLIDLVTILLLHLDKVPHNTIQARRKVSEVLVKVILNSQRGKDGVVDQG